MCQHDVFLTLFVNVNKAFFAENTFLVNTEHARCLEVSIDWSISEDFLHHFFLGRVSPATANEIRFFDLGNWFALLIILAIVTLGLVNVRSTVLADQVAVLRHENVEVWPSAVASFIHIIASHQHLRRQHWRLLTVLEFDPRLHDLGH